MKIAKVLVTAAVLTNLATSALAAPLTVSHAAQRAPYVLRQEQTVNCHRQAPLKAMENKKAKIQELVKAGRITQEEAEIELAKLEEKIRKINEFNALDLPQKKAKLLAHYQEVLEKRVQEGKITQQEAEQLLKKFSEKVEQWDGTGFPHLDQR